MTVADFGAQAIVAYTLQERLPDGQRLSLVAEETAAALKLADLMQRGVF